LCGACCQECDKTLKFSQKLKKKIGMITKKLTKKGGKKKNVPAGKLPTEIKSRWKKNRFKLKKEDEEWAKREIIHK
jgi:hypothetical protein